MRLPKKMQRRQRRAAALVCVGIAWLIACGCQSTQLDRLDGSTSTYSSGEPIVDNGPPPAHPAAHDSSAAPGADALAQARPINESAIAENLNSGHREAALNHDAEAEACYRKALDLDPDNPLANHRLAILADRRSDFAVSERCYLKALSREPNNADLLSDLGYSYFLQGRTRESERCLQAAVRANPLHQMALDNLSLLYAKLGDRERTFEVLKRSLGESAARTRLAQLFPPNRGASPEDETFTASFTPFQSHETADQASAAAAPAHKIADTNDQQPAPSTVSIVPTDAVPAASLPPRTAEPVTPSAQTPLEKQLADLMERERQRALEERTQRQAIVLPTTPAVPAAPVAQPAVAPQSNIAAQSQGVTHWSDPPAPAAMRPEPPPTSVSSVPNSGFAAAVAPRPIPTDRVPDDRINDAFSAIDREGTDGSTGSPSSAETVTAPPRPTSTPLATPTATNSPWDQPTAPSRTGLGPGEDAVPVAPSPRRPLPVENATSPPFPTVATPSADSGSSTAAAPQNPGATASARTASAPNGADEWDAARSGTSAMPTTLTPTPDPNVPSANANSPSPVRPAGPSWTAASLTEENQSSTGGITISSGSTLPRPAAADPKGWDRDPDPTPQWPGTGGPNTADRSPSGSAATTSSFDWQNNPSPRIVPVSVVPTARTADPSQAPRTADALDEFESDLQKNRRNVTPGKSTSNAAIAAKPSIQPLPRNQQASANAAAGDSSAAASDPWSLRIQPRRDPPPLFAPDDITSADKKPPAAKPTQSAPPAAATSWSDLPTWQSPASGNPPGDNGPAIHPGS
jgi:tetratricopeptide (TPR) repeat protein